LRRWVVHSWVELSVSVFKFILTRVLDYLLGFYFRRRRGDELDWLKVLGGVFY
jgi:hypothetical protein